MTWTNERGRATVALILLCVLVGATVPAAVTAGPPDAAADDGRAGTATTDRIGTTQASTELVAAAREGAERGLADAAAAGITVTADQRLAVVQGAELGATVSSTGVSFGVGGGEGAERARVAPADLRAAARGAAYGAVGASTEYRVTDQAILPSVAGASAGAALSAALVPTQGGRVTPTQIRAAAQGGSQGTALAAGEVAASGTLLVAPDALLTAAYGGAGGAVAAAGLLPIYGETAAPVQAYASALGGASGAVVGTQNAASADLPVDANGTAAAALGSSAGAMAAVLQRPDVETVLLYRAARGSAIETLGREDLATTDQLSEAALTGAFGRLADLPQEGDALFPAPLVIAGQTFAIGPPADPDSDGRYEDVNGNSVLSYSDVVTLSIVHDALGNGRVSLSAEQVAAFDFNGDGVFDARDVRALNEEITGGP